MAYNRLIVSFFCIALLSGCDQDIIPSPFEKPAPAVDKRELEEAREREAERLRLDADRQALRLYVSTQESVVSNALTRSEQAVKSVASDRIALAGRIKEISRAQTKKEESVRDKTLLAVLDDDVVNDLAQRYLGRDFRLARLELDNALAVASEATDQQLVDLAANKAAHDEEVKIAKAETQRARESSRQAEKNMKAAIVQLEDRREKTNRRLHFVSATERTRLTKELQDIDSQLKTLRTSYDGMRATRDVAYERSKAGREEAWVLDAAARRKATEDERVQRRFRGMKTAQTIVSECEQSTIRELERAMASKKEKQERMQVELRKAQSVLTMTSAGITGLGSDAMKRTRKDIDALMNRLVIAD